MGVQEVAATLRSAYGEGAVPPRAKPRFPRAHHRLVLVPQPGVERHERRADLLQPLGPRHRDVVLDLDVGDVRRLRRQLDALG